MTEPLKTGILPAGQIPEKINSPWDCQTFSVDGVYGMSANPYQVKIQFVEHFAGEDKLYAKHVVNMVVDVAQFVKLRDGFNALAEKLDLPTEEGNA